MKIKVKYKLKERDMNKAGQIDRAQPDRYEASGMEEEKGESPGQDPDLDGDGIYSASELEYHFDLNQDGEVKPEEYKDHVKWHEKHPEVFEIDESLLYEKKDRCYNLAKRKYKVFPSAYASGFIVRCRKGKVAKKKS